MQHQRTQQSHKLRNAWEAQDYAEEAKRYAVASQQFHNLISERSVVLQAEDAQLRQAIQFLQKEVKRIESNSDDQKRSCMIWGGVSGVVVAVAMNLILSPQPQTQRPLKPYYPPAMERGQ